jgi:nucleotide-binding universal stress UspA family protein
MATRPLVLLCYDGSEGAREAIRHAGALLHSRRALVLTVWQPLAGLDSLAWAGESVGMANSLELDRAAADAGALMAREGERLADAVGFGDSESLAIEATGPIWKTITDAAEAHDAEVIVLGSRGLTGLRSLLLGSVSNAVLHHTRRPTLVVHRSRDGDDDGVTESSGDGVAGVHQL